MSRAAEQFIAAFDRFRYYWRPHSAEQQTNRAVRSMHSRVTANPR